MTDLERSTGPEQWGKRGLRRWVVMGVKAKGEARDKQTASNSMAVLKVCMEDRDLIKHWIVLTASHSKNLESSYHWQEIKYASVLQAV